LKEGIDHEEEKGEGGGEGSNINLIGKRPVFRERRERRKKNPSLPPKREGRMTLIPLIPERGTGEIP